MPVTKPISEPGQTKEPGRKIVKSANIAISKMNGGFGMVWGNYMPLHPYKIKSFGIWWPLSRYKIGNFASILKAVG